MSKNRSPAPAAGETYTEVPRAMSRLKARPDRVTYAIRASGMSLEAVAARLGLTSRMLGHHCDPAERHYLIGPNVVRLADLSGVEVDVLTGEKDLPGHREAVTVVDNGDAPPAAPAPAPKPETKPAGRGPVAVAARVKAALYSTNNPHSRAEVAELMGVSAAMLDHWTSGRSPLHGKHLANYCAVVRADFAYLTGDSDDETPPMKKIRGRPDWPAAEPEPVPEAVVVEPVVEEQEPEPVADVPDLMQLMNEMREALPAATSSAFAPHYLSELKPTPAAPEPVYNLVEGSPALTTSARISDRAEAAANGLRETADFVGGIAAALHYLEQRLTEVERERDEARKALETHRAETRAAIALLQEQVG